MENAQNLAKAIMESRNIKTKELAVLLGTSQSTAWRISEGKCNPGAETYRRLVELSQEAA